MILLVDFRFDYYALVGLVRNLTLTRTGLYRDGGACGNEYRGEQY